MTARLVRMSKLEVAAGESHAEAIVLLRRCGPEGASAVAQLKRLLDAKTTTQYSAILIGEGKAAQLLIVARRLVEEMDSRLRKA
ncbi:hypothetical protein [Specibacter cremeus]|uniref:hypothetical protein n=1 Tax=Specibacter cremeus TaxID=1629051 RepID=UPI000F7A64EB|nr:hypothetical protein [Specibacter cremeus]